MAIPKEVLDALLKDYKGPDDLVGPDGLLKELTKALVERAMQAEMTEQLGYDPKARGAKAGSNRRNGTTKKTVRSDQGPMTLEVPRDREGSFEPRIIPKHQREFKGFDDKILSMYARGMSTREISGHLKEMRHRRIAGPYQPGDRFGEGTSGRVAHSAARGVLPGPVPRCDRDQSPRWRSDRH